MKRAQTTQNASFGHQVSFFIHFSCFFSLLNHVYRYYMILELRSDYLEATMREMGPNDAPCAVWALGKFSF